MSQTPIENQSHAVGSAFQQAQNVQTAHDQPRADLTPALQHARPRHPWPPGQATPSGLFSVPWATWRIICPTRTALENTAAQLRTVFGAESLPAGITDLPPASDAARKFHRSLFSAMRDAKVSVTPAVLWRLAEDILKPMAAKHALQDVLAQKAAAMKVAIRPEALPLAVEALLAAKGQSGMTLVDVGNTHTARALVDEVSTDRLETFWKMPPYGTAWNRAICPSSTAQR